MARNWNVETALTQVTDAMQQGSSLRFTGAEIAELKEFYRPGFSNQHARHADWDADQKVIVPLAKKVGAMAALFTSAAAIFTGEPIPTVIDPQMAMRAAMVGAEVCRLKIEQRQGGPLGTGDPKKFGVYCPEPHASPVHGADESENLALARHLADVWTLLQAVAQRSGEPAALARTAG